MAKMTVIYRNPKEVSAFEKHYFDVHIFLAKQLPRLIKCEINGGEISSTTGHSPFRIANLYFESMDVMQNAFMSEIRQQCAADRKILVPNNEDVQIYYYETRNV